jgi:DMSO/TMAO reductase YedYZ molybdopterin-dependent catalytic subunit
MAGVISRGFGGRRVPAGLEERVPPGQYVVTDFPVLSAGPTPRTALGQWSFTIEGLVRTLNEITSVSIPYNGPQGLAGF